VTRGEQLAMSFDEPDTDTVLAGSAPPADAATSIATAHNGTKQSARPSHVAGSAVGLRDQSDRDRMAAGVGQRVVAVAGAGSGKTTQLVQRVLTTLAGTADVAPVPSSKLAVITFTDKAARELIHRLRREAAGPIDDAYVGTIHGFCASILRSFPIEAGLPPKFSTADEITSRTDAEARARAIVSRVYDLSAEQPELREALAVVAAHVGLQCLPSVVAVIDQRWDQFEQLVLASPSADDIARLHAAVLAAGDDFIACNPKPSPTLARFVEGLEAARGAAPEIAAAARLVLPSLGGVGGKVMADGRAAIKDACTALNGAARTIVLHRLIEAFQPLVLDHAKRRIANGQLGYDDLLVLTRRLLVDHPEVRTELRRRYQRVFVDEFQDTDRVQFEIIDLLTSPDDEPAAGSPRLFAVGDPKQSIYAFRQAEVELFTTLAGAADAGGYLARLTANFRTRANVAAWINTVMARRFALPLVSKAKCEELGALGVWPPEVKVPYEPLAAERPSVAAGEDTPGPAVVLLGVDETPAPTDDSAGASGSDGDVADPTDGLAAAPAPPALQARTHETAELAQRAEATDVVGVVERAVGEGWGVLEEVHSPDGTRTWSSRAARRRDIAVLVARRTGLGELEDTLRRAGIPYRVEGGTLAYDRREVYELLRVLRAVSNPADELHLVTALRTSILGCSDRDLFAYRHRQVGRRGTWRIPSARDLPEPPAPGDESEQAGIARVKRALVQIDAWAREAHRRSPAALLTTIYDWSMGAAAAEFEGQHMVSETWRRVRYLIDEARAWTDETGGTLQEYLAWVADKVETVERSEIAPDETDEDAVRILTIHAAKGLEFPIVVVAGLGTKDNFMADQFRVAFTAGGAELKLGALATPGFPGRDEIAAWAEEARLLYVAMTRARDHLVVSCHTSERSNPNPAQRIAGHLEPSGAERWSAPPVAAAGAGDLPGIAELRAVVADRPVTDDELLPRPSLDRRTVWTPSALAARDHDAIVEGSPAELAATDDAEPAAATAAPLDAVDPTPRDPGLARDPASGLEALRSRGRYGTDAGKAVHEVMQRVDLADPTADLQALVDAACDNVDLVDADQRDRVARLAASIIASGLFQRMRTAAVCEREIYVGAVAEVDGVDSTIWGYADAVFQTETGAYAVVDFKTDSSATTEAELRERYRAQLTAYADVIERATDTRVGELWLLVGRTNGPAQEIAIARA
jgi:ATP-dependent exoDNAse (exonuclease V) beta subunit